MTSSSEVPDKHELYGQFTNGEQRNHLFDDRKRRFSLKLAHKAVDIPFEEDEMNITANKTGLGGGAIAAIVAAAGIGPALMAAMLLMKPPSPAQATQPIKEVIDNTVDKSIEVKSYVEQE